MLIPMCCVAAMVTYSDTLVIVKVELQKNDQRICLKTIICTIPEPEPETRDFWSNPTRTRPEVKKPYSSRPGWDRVSK